LLVFGKVKGLLGKIARPVNHPVSAVDVMYDRTRPYASAPSVDGHVPWQPITADAGQVACGAEFICLYVLYCCICMNE
jgi:hypothetical protein